MTQLYLSSPHLTEVAVQEIQQALGIPTGLPQIIHNRCVIEMPENLGLSKYALESQIAPIVQSRAFDYALIEPETNSAEFKLLAMDMDSTVITIECIDEIADFAGKKAEVAEITEAAMRGEITNFTESLYRRVALLKGVPESALEAVYQERLKLSSGAEELIEFAKLSGWKTLLVSGGFTFFTQRIQKRLGLDYTRANTLEVVDGQLTGRVIGTVVDGECKKQTVLEVCKDLGIDPSKCIAIGDGANDLPMMSIAGASVAYKAKPKVQEQTKYRINFGGLDTVAFWLTQHR